MATRRWRQWSSWCLAATATVATLLAAGGCASTIGETIDDATITARVKTALLNDVEIGPFGIEVDTRQGIVTLAGRVSGTRQIERAMAIAQRVEGVTEVRSRLGIVPAPFSDPP